MAEAVQLLIVGQATGWRKHRRCWVELGKPMFLGSGYFGRLLVHRDAAGDAEHLCAEIAGPSGVGVETSVLELSQRRWAGFRVVPRAWDRAGQRVLIEIVVRERGLNGHRTDSLLPA